MMRTSVQMRRALGRAADTAARPPTRMKSSISGVTNSTLKKCPRARRGYKDTKLVQRLWVLTEPKGNGTQFCYLRCKISVSALQYITSLNTALQKRNVSSLNYL